jgi:4Fe-4S ferredoxin
MAFATVLLSREMTVDDCPPLQQPEYRDNYEKLRELLPPTETASETGMLVHPELCTGCGNCVVACPVNVVEDPFGAGSGKAPQGDTLILKVEDGIVTLANVDSCRRFGPNSRLCTGCIATCPTKAIEFV